MNTINRGGLTLVELVIAVTISALIMFFIGGFVANSLNEIAESNVESRFQEDFVNFNGTLNNYRNVFLTGSVFIDNTGTGSDVLMLTSLDKDAGIIVGVVDRDTMRLENTQERYELYYNKVLGYRDISETEIIELENDPSQIFYYDFFADKVFDEIKIIDFQLGLFNNEQILDIDMKVNKDYKTGLNGSNLDDLESLKIKLYNLNF